MKKFVKYNTIFAKKEKIRLSLTNTIDDLEQINVAKIIFVTYFTRKRMKRLIRLSKEQLTKQSLKKLYNKIVMIIK